jgi:hypothetical protein
VTRRIAVNIPSCRGCCRASERHWRRLIFTVATGSNTRGECNVSKWLAPRRSRLALGLIWNIKAKNFLASFRLAFYLTVHGPPQ